MRLRRIGPPVTFVRVQVLGYVRASAVGGEKVYMPGKRFLVDARPSLRLARGVSLVELLVLIVVGLVLTAVAIPNLRTGIALLQLRSAAGNLAGLLQSARFSSAKTNGTCTITTTTIGSSSAIFVDANNNGVRDSNETVLTFSPPITFTTAPTGTKPSPWAPSGDSNNTVLADSAVLGFGPRGLPCIHVGANCVTPSGYKVYYLTNNGASGSGYALVAVSPAGRTRAYFWTGKQWQ